MNRDQRFWCNDVDPDMGRAFPRVRRRSKREWGEARALLAADQVKPAPIENLWLITGPDRMPKGDRHKLWALKTFHRYVREDVMDMSRDAWLEKTRSAIGFDLLLRYEYHHKKMRRIYEMESPFMALIDKRDTFADNWERTFKRAIKEPS